MPRCYLWVSDRFYLAFGLLPKFSLHLPVTRDLPRFRFQEGLLIDEHKAYIQSKLDLK